MELIRAILNYQFGSKVGTKILEKYKGNIKIEFSKNTGRARRIFINNKYFGTIEPTTGFIVLSFYGAKLVKEILPFPKYRVIIRDEAVPFVERGKSVFNKFVEDVYSEILPMDVVLVVDSNDRLIATGIAILSAIEMKQFDIGVAVKVKDARAISKE